MHTQSYSHRLHILALLFTTTVSSLLAATDTWNNGQGNFSWDATSTNWGGNTLWNNSAPDSAVFGSTGVGTITLGIGITAGSITFDSPGYVLSVGANSLTATTLAGSSPFTKIGANTFSLSGASSYTSSLTVGDGILQLNNGASLLNGGGLSFQGGAGTPGGSGYPFLGVTRGGTLYVQDNSMGNVVGGQTVTLNNGSVLWYPGGSGAYSTVIQNLSLIGGFNTVAVAPNSGNTSLLIGNMVLSGGAAVEFRSAYDVLGIGPAEIQITNINSAAIANANGILGGWAFVAQAGGTNDTFQARTFASWNGSTVVAATPDKANGGSGGTVNNQNLTTGVSTENWLANSTSGNRTLTADTTINSLIEEQDAFINNGAKITLNSGGLILRSNNFWMQTSSGATGFLTSGSNDLYVQADGGSGDQAIKVIIEDGSAGAVTLQKSGAGLVKLSQINTYTGGTVVNQGTLDLQTGGAIGCIRGTVIVNPGGTLQMSVQDPTGYGGGATALTNINLNGGNLNINTTANQTLGSATINMTGGSITGPTGGNIDFFGGGSALNTFASPVSSTIRGVPISPLRQGSTTFTVAAGTTPSGIDLDISSVIQTTPSYGGDSTNASLIKVGAGTIQLDAVNTCVRPMMINGGTVLVNGSTAFGNMTVASGARLGGQGTIGGAVTIQSGGTLAPGFNGISKLTLSGTLNLNGGGTTILQMSKAGSVPTNDVVAVTGALVLGGNLVGTNVGPGALVVGDSFDLFNASTISGGFSSISLPPLPAGLFWDVGQLTVNGTIEVTTNAPLAVMPTFTPFPCAYLGSQWVTIGEAVPNVTIYYTTDGSDPTTNSAIYSGPILVPSPTNLIIKAYAVIAGYTNTPITTATYVTVTAGAVPPMAGPVVYGSRPGTPFLLYLSAVGIGGNRSWTATGLPAGLQLNTTNGVITGITPVAGSYNISWSATGSTTAVSNVLHLVSGTNLCLLPPIGWNSWSVFEGSVSETNVEQIADAIVHAGLLDYGFAYVNLDDRWAQSSRVSGNLAPDASRFPDGMPVLINHVHQDGLKFGVYTDAGTESCAGTQPGSYGYETNDAGTFADWGVDYVKEDYCNAPLDQTDAVSRYTAMGNAVASSGRSMVLAICNWGFYNSWQWASQAGGSLWRTGSDMRDNWEYYTNGIPPLDGPFGVLDALDWTSTNDIEGFQHPGGWNDPDLNPVGVDLAGSSGDLGATGLNPVQEHATFSIWALLSAPMIFNADFRQLDPQSPFYNAAWATNIMDILGNTEVWAVDQDPLGQQGVRVFRNGDIDVWSKGMSDGSIVLGIINRGPNPQTAFISPTNIVPAGVLLTIRDLWWHAGLGVLANNTPFSLAPYETRMLRLRPSTPFPNVSKLTGMIISGSQIEFSWPSDHTGWTLQSQTNGLGTNWLPVANSSGTNLMFIPVDPANSAVFFRLVYP